MESLGERLRSTREGKDIDFDQASKDTKIAIRYLQALEKEDFSGFPGEAYINGFLRNYGAYLDLDVQELLSLYRSLKIQEQPIPVEQLLRPPSVLPKIAIGAIVALIVLGAAGGGLYVLLNRPRSTRDAVPAPRTPVVYTMSGDSFEHRFYKGDSILVPAGTGTEAEEGAARDQLKLELQSLGEAITVRTPGGSVMLDLSQEAQVSLGENGASDLRISALDYDKDNADMGVLLRFEISGAPAVAETVAAVPVETATVTSLSSSTVIFSSPSPYPFTLQSNFLNFCMFRWEILMERDRRDRNERYFQRSDELSIQAQNGIRVWASNAQAAKFQVIGGGRTIPVEIGNAGEVVVADIRWVRGEDNLFRLIVARLENNA